MLLLLLPIVKSPTPFWMRPGCFHRGVSTWKIPQYLICVYWFCSKGFIMFSITAPKLKQSHCLLVSRIRSIIAEKLLLLGCIKKNNYPSLLALQKMIYYNEITLISSGIMIRHRLCFLLQMKIHNRWGRASCCDTLCLFVRCLTWTAEVVREIG